MEQPKKRWSIKRYEYRSAMEDAFEAAVEYFEAVISKSDDNPIKALSEIDVDEMHEYFQRWLAAYEVNHQ